MYGIEIFCFSVFIPASVSYFLAPPKGHPPEYWYLFGLYCILLILGFVIYKLFKDESRYNAKNVWAEQIRQRIEKQDEIIKEFIANKKRLTVVESGLKTLSSVLKLPIKLCKYSTVTLNNSNLRIQTNVSTMEIYNNLWELCKYISGIFSGYCDNKMRCGLIIKDPKDKNKLIPIVVYDPDDDNYVSQSVFDVNSFSGKIWEKFERKRQKPTKKFVTHKVIEDIPEHTLGNDMTWITLNEDQKVYMKWIAGNVIYYKDPNDRTQEYIVGVMNLDCDVTKVISDSEYKELCPYLFPVYRLIAAELLLIVNSNEIFDALMAARRQRGVAQ